MSRPAFATPLLLASASDPPRPPSALPSTSQHSLKQPTYAPHSPPNPELCLHPRQNMIKPLETQLELSVSRTTAGRQTQEGIHSPQVRWPPIFDSVKYHTLAVRHHFHPTEPCSDSKPNRPSIIRDTAQHTPVRTSAAKQGTLVEYLLPPEGVLLHDIDNA